MSSNGDGGARLAERASTLEDDAGLVGDQPQYSAPVGEDAEEREGDQNAAD